MKTISLPNKQENFDKEAMERLVKFFSILIEIDQRNKEKEVIKDENKN